MRILVNALSVNNTSGRHVLRGHISRLAAWTKGRHEFTVLHHPGNIDLRDTCGPDLAWRLGPAVTGHWLLRAAWERAALPRVIREGGYDMLLAPSGTVTAGIRVPQVSFAQNPWALVRGLPRSVPERAKAFMQRRAYRIAMGSAQTMVFNSRYMRQAYRKIAGIRERRSIVVYQGVDDDTFRAAAVTSSVPRPRYLTLVVSEMAPHKGVETLVEALAILRRGAQPQAAMALVGRWPRPDYERRIRRLVVERGLQTSVEFAGFVAREDLYRRYARARVFALMSRCESFGIPAVEAQAFGTPVVSSNCCAIPEICGAGGVFPEPGDAPATAREIDRLMSDDTLWRQLSEQARANAARFHWDDCSRPFLRALDHDAPGDEVVQA